MPKIKVKRGSNSAWKDQTLEYGELGYNKDTKELMIGDKGENTKPVVLNAQDGIFATKSEQAMQLEVTDISRINQKAEVYANMSFNSGDSINNYQFEISTTNFLNVENRKYLGFTDEEEENIKSEFNNIPAEDKVGKNMNQLRFYYLMKKLSAEQAAETFWFGDIVASGYYIDKKYVGNYPFISSSNEIRYNTESSWWGIGLDFAVSENEVINITIADSNLCSSLSIAAFNTATFTNENISSSDKLTYSLQGAKNFYKTSVDTTYKVPAGCNRIIIVATQSAQETISKLVELKGVQCSSSDTSKNNRMITLPITRAPIKTSLYYPYTQIKVVSTNPEIYTPKSCTISVKYQKDTTKAYEELRQAIVSLGGNV